MPHEAPDALGSCRSGVVDVDPLSLDTEAEQAITLSGQILLIGGTSGIPDK